MLQKNRLSSYYYRGNNLELEFSALHYRNSVLRAEALYLGKPLIYLLTIIIIIIGVFLSALSVDGLWAQNHVCNEYVTLSWYPSNGVLPKKKKKCSNGGDQIFN